MAAGTTTDGAKPWQTGCLALLMGSFIILALYSCSGSNKPLRSGKITPGSIGCLTEAALDEAGSAAGHRDMRQLQHLLDSRLCFLIQGLDYSLVERTVFFARVRVYAGGTSLVLWTHIESLPRGR